MSGVGLCLTAGEAVVAVVRPDPPRLAALATVDLPDAVWHGGKPLSAACKSLVRVRRRLRLPRWSPVAVVVDPSLPAGDLLPDSAALLARAGLAQGWVITVERAATRLAAVDVRIDARLTPVAAGQQVGYAIGAALATFQPGAVPPEPDAVPRAALTGWAVQRVGPDEPSGAPATNAGWLVQT
jgi:hypothetical protein